MNNQAVPLFSAVASSARQLYFLLRCIGFATRVDVRITSEGLRFSTSETGVLESFIFLSKSLFTSYRLVLPSTDPTGPPTPPQISTFTLPLAPLLSTLQILTSAIDPTPSSRGITGPYSSDAYSSSFAAHRLNRHSAFSGSVLGTQGQCRIIYRAEGERLEISVPETGGVRTASALSTYLGTERRWAGGEGSDDEGEGRGEAQDIPFDREDLRLKAILPSSVLGDAVVEIGALGPPDVFVVEGCGTVPYLVLRGEGGAGGECRVEFGDEGGGGLGNGRTKLLETFLCQSRVVAKYGFGTIRKALVAMRAGTKVSMRIDGKGVLSLQFLIEMGDGGDGGAKVAEEVAFVDFRVVPLFEADGQEDSSSEEDD